MEAREYVRYRRPVVNYSDQPAKRERALEAYFVNGKVIKFAKEWDLEAPKPQSWLDFVCEKAFEREDEELREMEEEAELDKG